MRIMEQIYYLTKILVFCTLIFQIKIVTGCMCREVPLMKQFCNSDFVIKMKINDQADIANSSTRIYQFDIMKVYRMRSDGIPMLSQGMITTNYKLSCGVMLRNNDTLIYGGNFIGSQFPEMRTCDLRIQNEEAMKNFEKNYFISNPYYCEYFKFYTEAFKFFYRNLE